MVFLFFINLKINELKNNAHYCSKSNFIFIHQNIIHHHQQFHNYYSQIRLFHLLIKFSQLQLLNYLTFHFLFIYAIKIKLIN